MNNNAYNYNNPNHGQYQDDRKFNEFFSERNINANYYNNMNINKGGIYKNNSTPKMGIPKQKDNYNTENKNGNYQNYNNNYKIKENKKNYEEFTQQQNNFNNTQRFSPYNNVIPSKKSMYKQNNYNNNKNINHRHKSANTLNTINF